MQAVDLYRNYINTLSTITNKKVYDIIITIVNEKSVGFVEQIEITCYFVSFRSADR